MENLAGTVSYDLQSVLEEILANAVRALGGSAAVVATWDEMEHCYVVGGSFGLGDQELSRLRPLLGEAIPDLSESSDQFALLSELDPHRPLPVSRHGQTLNSMIALPLSLGGMRTGLIYVLRSFDAVEFSKLDPPVLAAFSEQAAIAIQNARLAHLLAQEKQRVESMLEGSADGIYTVDAQRRLVGLNSAMERMLGRPREEVIAQKCYEVLNFQDQEGRPLCPGNCPMLKRRGDAESTFEVEGKIRSLDGRVTDVAIVYSIVRSLEGSPLNAVVNVRDISQLRDMENLRSVFLSMLGHQLQTPLSIIKGYANTLSRSDVQWDEATLMQSFSAIEDEADRMSQLMNRLLLASRLESGELMLQKEPVKLESLAQKVVRRIQTTTDSHTFSVNFPTNFPAVFADPDLLEEVLINLTDNAIKYSPNGGAISLVGEVEGPWLLVKVSDQGVGIPWWETSRIFERFHRGQMQLTAETRGMGLGLYISNAIVSAHGGHIDLTSEAGEGSQFAVFLPAN